MKVDFQAMGATQSKAKSLAQRTGALIYCRVSTKEQADNLSLPVQEQKCSDYCKANGLEVLQVFRESESAKTVNRPVFTAMLNFCWLNYRSIAAVVFYDTTRFSRETADYHMVRALLRNKGIETRAATQSFDSTPSGEFLESVLAAAGTLDNRIRKQKTTDGMKAAIGDGRFTHRAPIGYINLPNARRGQPNLAQDEQLAPLIKQAFELYASGSQTKVAVLKVVTDLGLRNLAGKELRSQQFDKILRNPIYAGWIVSPSWGIVARGLFEPIVTEEVFKRAQDRFAGNGTSRQTRTREHPDFPLRVFVRCGVCGTPLTGSTSRGNGGRYSYYTCRVGSCRAVRYKQEDLHQKFIEFLYTLFPEEGFMPLFHEVVKDVWKQKQAVNEETAALLNKRIAALEGKKQQLIDAVVTERIDKATYDDQITRVGTDLAAAQSQLSETLISAEELECLLEFADWLLERVAGIWSSASADNKRRLQSALFPDGLTLTKEGFGTTPVSIFFKGFQPIQVEESGMASPAGFEPALPP